MKRLLLAITVMWLCMPPVAYAHESTDSLRTRPKIGLVLSGGGARGAAHIGVIRLIEEMKIPIDYVVGTSMGAIVGGLYAIGYTADEMDSLMMVQDWKTLLSNDVPRQQQPYALRMARKRYQINLPFEKSVFNENSVHYRDAGIKVRRNSLQTFPKVLARPGLIDGQNLLDVFYRLTYLYRDSVDYDTFPHAYACVAADLVTGKEVILSQGRLAESMRASMSIPGVFYPIYTQEQVLVDGGVVNNYPVNVARDMGAEVIIGVEVNTANINARELQSFASIFERLIGTLGSDLHERNVIDTDILIRPQVKRFPVMGFDTANLRQLIGIGYHTATQSREELDLLKQRLSLYLEESPGDATPAVPPVAKDIPLEPEEDARSRSNPTNQVALGLRVDSEDAAAALLSIGINRTERQRMKYNLTTRLSVNPWIEARSSYLWGGRTQLDIAAKYRFADVNRFYDKNTYTLNYNFYGADLGLSNLLSSDYDLRAGIRYDHFATHRLVRSEFSTYDYTDTEGHEAYTSLYAMLHNDKYDVAYFPTQGYAYGIEGGYYIKNRSPEGANFGELMGRCSFVVPLGRSTALIPALYARTLIGSRIPLIYSNAMGGYLPQRYLRQQFPFVGFVGSEFMGKNLTIFRAELRQRLFDDLYASGIINYAYSTQGWLDNTDSQKVWGVALQVAYDTTIGPLSLCAHWSDLYHKFGLYFNFGFDF